MNKKKNLFYVDDAIDLTCHNNHHLFRSEHRIPLNRKRRKVEFFVSPI